MCVCVQIENLQEQLRDKEKQMSSLKERVKSLQTDTSNTDTALNTLEESLAEKVHTHTRILHGSVLWSRACHINSDTHLTSGQVVLPKPTHALRIVPESRSITRQIASIYFIVFMTPDSRLFPFPAMCLHVNLIFK